MRQPRVHQFLSVSKQRNTIVMESIWEATLVRKQQQWNVQLVPADWMAAKNESPKRAPNAAEK
jgi:hypothetical protein